MTSLINKLSINLARPCELVLPRSLQQPTLSGSIQTQLHVGAGASWQVALCRVLGREKFHTPTLEPAGSSALGENKPALSSC